MSDKNDTAHYNGVLLEDIQHKFDIIIEGQAALASVPGDVAQLKADMIEVKSDIKTIKAVMTNHSLRLAGHEKRFHKLER